MNVLVVEDDARIADFLDRGLRAEGHRVLVARNGPDGLALARDAARAAQADDTPTVLLLDVMLPGMSGLEVCQTLRAAQVHLPILMLTALGTLEDRVSGLRLGADDYLVKPFEFEELLARIDALARRGHRQASPTRELLVVADLELDTRTMRASRAGRPLSLTARELALLELLMSSPGRLFSRERILANVWGTSEDPLTNVVDVYIRRLRSKVDDGFPRPLIHTQRGLGYRLEDLPRD
ncbi:response regulator with CheY-like receiver domain and winged-helix DNA-binding domain [Burkholderiales bacterium JOSHI_001]|nr:response regulator with CheY-like receiver domain and winged-helix DNA-binding domain [Burkholderiales bacterium JOSHI_001]